MVKPIVEDYICEQCGNTTPVPNEFCPSCGAPMPTTHKAPAATRAPADGAEDDDTLFDDETAGFNGDGTESLDALREEEAEDDSDAPTSSDY